MKIRQGRIEPPRCYYAPESHVDPDLYERLSQQSPQA